MAEEAASSTRDGERSEAARALLDTAERLFSERGFFGVSIREIVKDAGQTLAAVNYHFGTKENLFASVVSRRAFELNSDRLQRLSSLSMVGEDSEQQIRHIARAFVLPLCVRATNPDNPGWKYYGRLIADIGVSRYFTANLISPEYDETARLFISAFSSVYPNASDWSLHISYQFMLGSMLYVFAESGRLETVSRGKFQSSAIAEITEDWVEFTSAGLIGYLSK